jgi:hypothetical protein
LFAPFVVNSNIFLFYYDIALLSFLKIGTNFNREIHN